MAYRVTYEYKVQILEITNMEDLDLMRRASRQALALAFADFSEHPSADNYNSLLRAMGNWQGIKLNVRKKDGGGFTCESMDSEIVSVVPKPQAEDKGLDRLLRRRGFTLIHCQRIPRIDRMTAPLSVVLYKDNQTGYYAVHTYNHKDQAFHDGAYCGEDFKNAIGLFCDRVEYKWPEIDGKPVPSDHPDIID
jgi:hypothetical protein